MEYHHSCEPNRPRVTAELLRHKMKNIVRKNPTQAVGKAVRLIRIEAAEEFGDEDEVIEDTPGTRGWSRLRDRTLAV